MLLITVVLNVLVALIIAYAIKETKVRIAFIAFNIAFFFYSAYGIHTYSLNNSYYGAYIVMMLVMNICFYLGNRLYKLIYETGRTTRINKTNALLEKKANWVRLLTIIYISIRVLELFYPELYLKYLFTTPNLLYSNLYTEGTAPVSGGLSHLLSTIKMLLLPFALIHINKLKMKYIVLYFVFDLVSIYCLGGASIGRLSIITAIITICLILYIRGKTPRKKSRMAIVMISGILFSFVIYIYMQNLRNGVALSIFSINPIDAIVAFARSEFFYPRNYELANSLHEIGVYQPYKFWLWLFTLPIPKAFISIPGVDLTTSIIYRVFSYHYFGGQWYYEGVGGMLLSVLGDGILVYGKELSFIIMIPFALFMAFFMSYLNGIKNGDLLFYTTFFFFIVSFRPGVQYGLVKINIFIGILLVLYVIKRVRIKSRYNIRRDFKYKER